MMIGKNGLNSARKRAGKSMRFFTVLTMAAFLALAYGAGNGTVSAADAPSAGKNLVNPFAGNGDAAGEGGRIFIDKCAECHGGDATGASGPDLTDKEWIYGNSDAAVYETVAWGRKGGMPSWIAQMEKDEIWKVVTYIRSRGGN
jgi:cbb3-type cytochrome c oxidase subunit III